MVQCKDIPDKPILEFLVSLNGRWANWFADEGAAPKFNNSVQHGMPPQTPPKLALAKMGRLIQRGLVVGCACGCRGDFEISEEGLRFLEAPAECPDESPGA